MVNRNWQKDKDEIGSWANDLIKFPDLKEVKLRSKKERKERKEKKEKKETKEKLRGEKRKKPAENSVDEDEDAEDEAKLPSEINISSPPKIRRVRSTATRTSAEEIPSLSSERKNNNTKYEELTKKLLGAVPIGSASLLVPLSSSTTPSSLVPRPDAAAFVEEEPSPPTFTPAKQQSQSKPQLIASAPKRVEESLSQSQSQDDYQIMPPSQEYPE